MGQKIDMPLYCAPTAVQRLFHHEGEIGISTRVVDMVRADVSWSGGITATMKTAHLAESFGVQCEIHTAIYHPLVTIDAVSAIPIENVQLN